MLDSIAKRFKVENKNDRPNEPQLVFFTSEGRLVSPTTSVTVSSLIASGSLLDGDNLILEYVPEQDINTDDDTELCLDPDTLNKYTFV